MSPQLKRAADNASKNNPYWNQSKYFTFQATFALSYVQIGTYLVLFIVLLFNPSVSSGHSPRSTAPAAPSHERYEIPQSTAPAQEMSKQSGGQAKKALKMSYKL